MNGELSVSFILIIMTMNGVCPYKMTERYLSFSSWRVRRLGWETVLKKSENYRKAFSNFDPVKVARYGDKKVEALMGNKGIIRNRLKITSAINNAKRFLEVQKEFGTFDTYIWQFVNGKPITNRFKSIQKLPATTKESDAMSKDLKKEGSSLWDLLTVMHICRQRERLMTM